MWVGYNLGCTMGFLMGHSAWQIDQFPTCWPMNGLFVHWSRGWGVLSFSERLVKSGIKTKTHFEWLLWHWSSLGQLNLEPTRPNGLVGCKVPIDLVKISVKEATHMGFHYMPNNGLNLYYPMIFHHCFKWWVENWDQLLIINLLMISKHSK